MTANRIRRYESSFRKPVPAVSATVSIPPGFVLCPPQFAAVGGWQAEIYRLAYERAKAATQIPRHHRLLFSVWN
jgi:hypothetical protein